MNDSSVVKLAKTQKQLLALTRFPNAQIIRTFISVGEPRNVLCWIDCCIPDVSSGRETKKKKKNPEKVLGLGEFCIDDEDQGTRRELASVG